MENMSRFAQFMWDATASAIVRVKWGLAHGDLIPVASCHQNEAGDWFYNFEIRAPSLAEPVFAAEGDNNVVMVDGGFPLRPTRFPPLLTVRKNDRIKDGNLLLFHQFAGLSDDELHHIRVEMKPLGDSGEFITLEATAPSGKEAQMVLL